MKRTLRIADIVAAVGGIVLLVSSFLAHIGGGTRSTGQKTGSGYSAWHQLLVNQLVVTDLLGLVVGIAAILVSVRVLPEIVRAWLAPVAVVVLLNAIFSAVAFSQLLADLAVGSFSKAPGIGIGFYISIVGAVVLAAGTALAWLPGLSTSLGGASTDTTTDLGYQGPTSFPGAPTAPDFSSPAQPGFGAAPTGGGFGPAPAPRAQEPASPWASSTPSQPSAWSQPNPSAPVAEQAPWAPSPPVATSPTEPRRPEATAQPTPAQPTPAQATPAPEPVSAEPQPAATPDPAPWSQPSPAPAQAEAAQTEPAPSPAASTPSPTPDTTSPWSAAQAQPSPQPFQPQPAQAQPAPQAPQAQAQPAWGEQQAAPAPAAAFTPFWAAVPTSRTVYNPDQSGSPVGYVQPGTWYAVVGQHASGGLIVQLPTGGHGVLVETDDLIRG